MHIHIIQWHFWILQFCSCAQIFYWARWWANTLIPSSSLFSMASNELITKTLQSRLALLWIKLKINLSSCLCLEQRLCAHGKTESHFGITVTDFELRTKSSNYYYSKKIDDYYYYGLWTRSSSIHSINNWNILDVYSRAHRSSFVWKQ